MKEQCDVLIVTASFGMGHNSAARAIREQLLEEAPQLCVVTKDLFEISSPRTSHAMFGMYRQITKSRPGLYNIVYNIKRDVPNNQLDEMLYHVYMERVQELLVVCKPKLVVSTFPMCSGIISRVKEKYNWDIPLVTSITDVVASWEWVHTHTDLYFVPCKDVQSKLIDMGIPKDKIKVTGIPVARDFIENSAVYEKQQLLKQILIMGNALDQGHKTMKLLKSLDALNIVKVVVITGNNHELYRLLTRKCHFKNVEVLPFTLEVARIMEKSDLVVTKPGGSTLFEAINLGVPLVLKRTRVGQEEANLKYVVESGLGLLIDEDEALESTVMSLLKNTEMLNQMRHNLNELRMEIEPEKVGQYALALM